MSPTAATESIAGLETAKKEFSVPSPSTLVMLKKATLSLPSWKLGDFGVPRFPCAVS